MIGLQPTYEEELLAEDCESTVTAQIKLEEMQKAATVGPEDFYNLVLLATGDKKLANRALVKALKERGKQRIMQ